ncbi:hypothetical protein, partial [Amphritea sp.]|uniref:hypothetical protein n=1 Tax=Amphritea sp. TaxID=1872502 RepID=UPI003565198D
CLRILSQFSNDLIKLPVVFIAAQKLAKCSVFKALNSTARLVSVTVSGGCLKRGAHSTFWGGGVNRRSTKKLRNCEKYLLLKQDVARTSLRRRAGAGFTWTQGAPTQKKTASRRFYVFD